MNTKETFNPQTFESEAKTEHPKPGQYTVKAKFLRRNGETKEINIRSVTLHNSEECTKEVLKKKIINEVIMEGLHNFGLNPDSEVTLSAEHETGQKFMFVEHFGADGHLSRK